MQSKTVLIAVLMSVVAMGVGGVAFTDAEVDRDVNVETAGDSAAVIGLTPGATDAASLNDGALVIDTSTASADGLNVDGTFNYGDQDNPNTENTFTLTNNDDSANTITVEYLADNAAGDNVEFYFYDETDQTQVAAINAGDTEFSSELNSGESVDVVMVVNTNGLTDNDDLSGTLQISAN